MFLLLGVPEICIQQLQGALFGVQTPEFRCCMYLFWLASDDSLTISNMHNFCLLLGFRQCYNSRISVWQSEVKMIWVPDPRKTERVFILTKKSSTGIHYQNGSLGDNSRPNCINTWPPTTTPSPHCIETLSLTPIYLHLKIGSHTQVPHTRS